MVRRGIICALVVVVLLVAATSGAAPPPYPRPNLHGVRLGPNPPATTPVDCWDCHWFSQENAFNYLRVSPLVLGAAGPVSVSFPPPPTGPTYVNTGHTGICQVCHTKTKYWGYNYDYKPPATGPHFPDLACTTCHPHWPTDPLQGLFEFTMVGPQSHATHLSDCKGPRLSGCTACHLSTDFTRFLDGQPIATTTICDSCHSAGGPVNGVSDPVVGAKPNWLHGVYDGDQLKPGKEHWCDGCHDSGTSVVKGVQAPNILGDNSSYGYNVSGHGRDPGDYVGCLQCHEAGCSDSRFEHCDGNARTYDRSLWPANPSNYVPGYRLNDYLNIPKWDAYGTTQYNLCFNCHDAAQLFDTGGIIDTNFRNDRRHRWNNRWANNLHYAHLTAPPTGLGVGPLWDSDWDGSNTEGGGDSTVSCPACHNVHGSASPKMIRHAELVSTHPDLKLNWYTDYDLVTRTGMTTESLLDSRWGTSDIITGFTSNHVCTGCHGTGSESYFRYPHEVLVPVPGSPAPQPLVNALVWTSNTADTPQTQFTRNSLLRIHVEYYVCPFSTPPPYDVFRRLRIPSWGSSFAKNNKAPLQVESAYSYYWDVTVPSTAASGNTRVRVLIDGTIGGTLYSNPREIFIKVVP